MDLSTGSRKIMVNGSSLFVNGSDALVSGSDKAVYGSDGLINLQKLAGHVALELPQDRAVPIVLVPGFSGWGSPLFGAINYWGGIECIPKLLMDKGYTVIVTPIAPLSSNWERACELYRQLTFGKFNRFDDRTNEVEDIRDVDIDYGTYFASDPERGPITSKTKNRKRAILFSKTPGNYDNWEWGENRKVHFICHSQGGNTVRYLISLMSRGAGGLHPYFNRTGRDKWIISVTTLGTPHRGTTIINVLENCVLDVDLRVGLLAKAFATISYQNPAQRAYDLQLDHWGICRKGTESFEEMRQRLGPPAGPVWKWLESNRNGFYDNSIEGVNELHKKADATSKHIYYFSLSFHATTPFPSVWPLWAIEALNSFPIRPVNFLRKVLYSIPVLGAGTKWAMDNILHPVINQIEWAVLPRLVSVSGAANWATEALANQQLRNTKYNVRLPQPGKYLPRTDVLPLMQPTCYAMAGTALTPEQRAILATLRAPGADLGDWYQNDGIVNTESMRGPQDSAVNDAISRFPTSTATINSIKARGKYWHLGVNDAMDHADEIGIFTDQGTASGTTALYFNLAELVSRLPTAP